MTVGDVLSSLLLASVLFMVLVGNCLVVAAVATSRKLRTVTNVFIVNLACADLLLGVFVLPFSAVLEVKDRWVFGNIWCQVWLAVDVWLCTASILNLCCISLDRYLAITRPIRYPGLMSARRAKTLVACVWIFSFLICCPPLVGWNDSSGSVQSDDNDFGNINGSRHKSRDGIKYEIVSTTRLTSTQSIIPTGAESVILTTEPACSTKNSNNSNHGPFRCSSAEEERVQFLTACELTNSQGYRIYAALGSFFIPMLVMVFFYLQIYRAAVKTIAAYNKGELKTKYGVREDSSGGRPNSVTLRIHRGGSSSSALGDSLCSVRNQRGMSYTNSTASSQGRTIENRQNNGIEPGRSRRFDSGSPGIVYDERPKYSDASIVSISELKSIESGASLRGSSKSNGRHLILCWKKGRWRDRGKKTETPICHNCGADIKISKHRKRDVLRCISNESAEPSVDSSSADSRKHQLRQPEHGRTSPHNAGSFERSCSFKSETSLTRSSTEMYGRGMTRARFATPRPANVIKIHMQKFNREKKAAKTLAIIVGAFILCWMPFFTIYLVGAFCESCIPPVVFSVTFWLGYCNSAMNPCVYGLFSKDFRFAFRKLLTCRCQMWRNHVPRFRDNRAGNRVPAIQLHQPPQEDAKSSSDNDNNSR
ncbi:octopamine receptor 1 [Elysia marginata]|uniref:Octopamine receptor 1 n=1 Tax=Elysia marginata TaxID=1093978 RepID=A0AAV4EBP8_9GAST|nr:octopamine receptor 1 [Elysia marginata]